MGSFCANCGEAINDNFCANCGSPKVTETTNAGQPLLAVPDQEGQLFAERVRQIAREKELEEERIEAERRQRQAEELAEAKKRASEERRARNAVIIATLLKWKAVTFPAIGLALVMVVYGISQASITASNGPSKQLEKVISAIKTADFDALQDPELFPGTFQPAPEAVTASFDKSMVKDAKVLSVKQTGDIAIARISFPYMGDEFEVSLKSTTKWEGIFQVPHWKITRLGGGGADFAPDASLVKGQKLTFENLSGGEDRSYSVKSVGAWKPMSLLPGYYTINVAEYGFSGGDQLKAAYLPVTSETASIPLSSYLEITPAVQTRADTRAAVIAGRCGRSKCSKLSQYTEYDFTLWSKWTYSKYTSSSFDYKWSLDYCSKDSEEILSPTLANFTYTCNMTANAHLYVKWVYYYGYYSDYYYYDNIYDSQSDTVTVSFKIRTTKSGR